MKTWRVQIKHLQLSYSQLNSSFQPGLKHWQRWGLSLSLEDGLNLVVIIDCMLSGNHPLNIICCYAMMDANCQVVRLLCYDITCISSIDLVWIMDLFCWTQSSYSFRNWIKLQNRLCSLHCRRWYYHFSYMAGSYRTVDHYLVTTGFTKLSYSGGF